MKNKFKFITLLSLSTFFVSGCCDPTFSNLAPHKFISGEKIFDLDIDDEMPSSIDLEEVEGIFKKVSGGFSFNNDLELPIINNQLYLADVNCDGSKDICYKYSISNEEQNSHELIIYDYKNAALLDRITCVDDYSGDYIDGEYFFEVDEENDILIKHSLQTVYFDESEDEDAEETAHRCYDTETKFLINEKSEFQKEDVPLPFKILSAYLYAGEYDSRTNEYSYTTDLRNNEFSASKEHYLFLRLDYEGTYSSKNLDQDDTRFTSMKTENINNYRVTFQGDMPSKRPYLMRLFKIKFLRTGEIRLKMMIKRKEYAFSINVID